MAQDHILHSYILLKLFVQRYLRGTAKIMDIYIYKYVPFMSLSLKSGLEYPER